MFSEYVETALARVEYKVIEDDDPYFASVPELPGVRASGRTVEECRKELIEVIEEWIVARLQRGLPIPPMGEHKIGVADGRVCVLRESGRERRSMTLF
jgi:predicted RNase H-like HicB family nuclease